MFNSNPTKSTTYWRGVHSRLERHERRERRPLDGASSFYSLVGLGPRDGYHDDGGVVAGTGILGDRLLLKVNEVAQVLGLGPTKTWTLVSSGEIPSIKIGGSRRVPSDKLRAWVDAKAQEATP